MSCSPHAFGAFSPTGWVSSSEFALNQAISSRSFGTCSVDPARAAYSHSASVGSRYVRARRIALIEIVQEDLDRMPGDLFHRPVAPRKWLGFTSVSAARFLELTVACGLRITESHCA